MQHKWICSVVDLEIFVRGPELFIFDSNRWLVYHDESSFCVFRPARNRGSAIKDSASIQFRWTCWTLHVPKSIHPFHESGLGWRVVETVNPSAFARPPTCFKAYLAWMFSLPKFPDPSTWPWWLSIWLWWLEDFFFFSSWRDIWETKRMKGRWTWPLITPFLFQVISSCNDECIDCSILVSDFLDSEEEISRFQANAVACKDYKSCIVGFFVAVFRWKIQTVDNPGADFLLETHHFQPIASSEKWWMCFPYPCHWFGKPRWFSGTPNSPRLLMVLLLRLLVVASEGRFLQRPTVGRIVAFCVLHLLFRSFWFYDPF